ncbi:MAG TPA: nuclear transport factor 2 family protein [Planctomycetota bacterium]|nr:nuclear transport factor 2 family protein [Planctomycetota bacterium]
MSGAGLALALLLAGCAASTARLPEDTAADVQRDAAAVLDALHAAASRADGESYFALFAPDAVFLGTDATERWSIEEFRAYAQPYFSRGQGWTYVPTERHVVAAPGGQVAWFDERLASDKYGEVRGSGVLLRGAAGWRIAQYNLALPVPNELAADLVARIRTR